LESETSYIYKKSRCVSNRGESDHHRQMVPYLSKMNSRELSIKIASEQYLLTVGWRGQLGGVKSYKAGGGELQRNPPALPTDNGWGQVSHKSSGNDY